MCVCVLCPAVKWQARELRGHRTFITALDWTLTGCLHSSDASAELLYFDVSTGRQITDGATLLRDAEWATWSTPFGYPVQVWHGGLAVARVLYVPVCC